MKRECFGHGKKFATELFPSGANRLFFGDNLHMMRQLPSKSIDLIYIDPPFFSGRNYNVIFGDKNEVRSFSDIWEGGMPGYLIWLNARENKRIDFVRLSLVRLEDKEFREHVTSKHKDYGELLSFIQPPEVRVEVTRIGPRNYRFDVSESVSLNPDGNSRTSNGISITAIASPLRRASPFSAPRAASQSSRWNTSSTRPARKKSPVRCRTIKAANEPGLAKWP